MNGRWREFYERKKRLQGAAWRYETIFQKFPETDRAPKALAKAIELYREHLDDQDRATRLQKIYDEKYPEQQDSKDAKTP